MHALMSISVRWVFSRAMILRFRREAGTMWFRSGTARWKQLNKYGKSNQMRCTKKKVFVELFRSPKPLLGQFIVGLSWSPRIRGEKIDAMLLMPVSEAKPYEEVA